MMILIKTLCSILLVTLTYISNTQCRSFNNGLIFYNLENHISYLPPTISVSRGRSLSKFKYSSRGSIWSTFGKPCDCKGPLCGCCVGIQVKQYNFDQKMCANVTYARPKDEIELEVFLNDTATAKYGIAARNPSPLCIPIMMGIPMSMCIQMSNIAIQGDNLNMCMDFLVRLASTEIFEMHFQCMKVGLQGASWVGSDGQPVIPANKVKIKDKSTNESEDYYDESEEDQENKILSEEKDEENSATNMQEADLEKEEEEIDYNDMTEKIMNLVKGNEKESSLKTAEIVKNGQMVHDNKNVEEIVTNIMESINKGNAAAENSSSVLKGTQGSSFFVKNYGDSVELNAEENLDEFIAEGAVDHSEANANNEGVAEEKENQIENNVYDNQEPGSGKEENDNVNTYLELGITPYQENAAEQLSNNLGSSTTAQLDTLINTTDDVEEITEISNNDMKFNNSLETLQKLPESSTEKVKSNNLKPTASQNVATTSEIRNINNINNSLTTAAIMATTTTKTTTTNMPTINNKNSAMATTLIKNADEIVNEDDDQDESQENSDGDDDDDVDDGAGDNSYENVSDYEDEESEEMEDEIIENEIQLNNTSSANCISHKASATKHNQANDAVSNESLSNDKTNGVFVTENEVVVENADDEKDFEDYKTTVTTMEAIGENKIYTDNSTCCKSTIAPALNNSQIIKTLQLNDNNYKAHKPQVDKALSNNIELLSNSNNMTGNNKVKKNILNVEPTTYKAMQVIAASTAATTPISSGSTNSSDMPLSLARKLFALHHPLKQQRHHYATRQHH